MDKSRKFWAVLNTVTNKRITNKIFIREAISFQRRRTHTKTPCVTKSVPIQLCSLLRHIKFPPLYKWPRVPFLIFKHYNFVLLILRSVGGNTRDVTAKQTDGSLPVTWSAVSSRYQHAACCVVHHLTVTIITVIVTMQNWGKLAKLIR